MISWCQNNDIISPFLSRVFLRVHFICTLLGSRAVYFTWLSCVKFTIQMLPCCFMLIIYCSFVVYLLAIKNLLLYLENRSFKWLNHVIRLMPQANKQIKLEIISVQKLFVKFVYLTLRLLTYGHLSTLMTIILIMYMILQGINGFYGCTLLSWYGLKIGGSFACLWTRTKRGFNTCA